MSDSNKNKKAIDFVLDSQKFIEECQKKNKNISNIEADTSKPIVTARDIFGDSATYIEQ